MKGKDSFFSIIRLYIIMILGVILGVYAQDITYYLGDNIEGLGLSYPIIIITVLSIGLFVIPAIKMNGKKEGNRSIKIYWIINMMVGIVTTGHALIVLMFWLS